MTAITYVPPVPVVMPAPATSHQAKRAAETAAVFARHLGPVLAMRAARREVAPAEIGRRLRLAFEALGSTYVKFGQLIGSSPGAFGKEVSDEFRTCLDTGPAVPFTHVRREVETAIRGRLDDVFESFEPVALASASIAVVHKARLRDGRDVAVKVLRPGIVERVASDLDVMEPLFKRLALAGIPIAGPLFRFLRGFRTQVCEELDLRNEARTMTYFRHLLLDSGLDSLVIPEPHPQHSNANVLVMEFLDGVAIDDVDAIAELGGDPGALMQDMLRAWFLTGLRDAMFHGDIHAGNLMLLRDGRAGIIDWGIVGRLDGPTHHLFRRFVEAVLGDATAWPEIVAFLQEMTPLPTVGDDAPAGIGIDEAEKDEIEAILTRPFGEVDLTGAFKGPGGNKPPKDRAEKRRRRAQLRRFRKDILGTEFVDSGFAQANFLLFKQLLYFERYGKLYLADQALMGDRPWLEKILAESARRVITPA